MSTSIVVAYPVTKEQLIEALSAYRGHSFSTPALYKEGTKAIAACRSFRVQIEERRKLLKQDSLEYGRKVDAVAKELVELIEMVEAPLKAAKREVDEAKERAKREAAEAERRAVEERIRQERLAEEAALREQRQAEEARLAEERQRLQAEREAAAKERAELEAIRAQLREQNAKLLEQAEKERAERVAAERAERLKVEAEERRINALEAEKQRQKRLAALQPDQDKLTQFARAVRNCADEHATWEFDSDGACQAADAAIEHLLNTAAELETWKEAQR